MPAAVVTIQIQGQIQWSVSQSAEGRYVAVCEPMGIAMEGATLDDLVANINESIQLVMNDLLRSGELDDFLRAQGWRTAATVKRSHTGGPVSFDVPIHLVMQAQRDSARAIRQ